MRRVRHFIGLVVSLAVLVGCELGPLPADGDAGVTASNDAGTFDAGGRTDAGFTDGGSTGALAMFPSWELTDIQPSSPRFNTSYGLNVFLGRPVVVVLLEGF